MPIRPPRFVPRGSRAVLAAVALAAALTTACSANDEGATDDTSRPATGFGPSLPDSAKGVATPPVPDSLARDTTARDTTRDTTRTP